MIDVIGNPMRLFSYATQSENNYLKFYFQKKINYVQFACFPKDFKYFYMFLKQKCNIKNRQTK